MKLDRSATYRLRFVHAFDESDIFETRVEGRYVPRWKQNMRDLGYLMRECEKEDAPCPTPGR